MATLKDLQKYLNYQFSSGGVTGKDYLSFQTKYINYLKSLCNENGWEFVRANKNHYEFSCFIRKDKIKYIYLNIGDVRWDSSWYNNILVRTALHERDYHGGRNQFASLPYLADKINSMFANECWL